MSGPLPNASEAWIEEAKILGYLLCHEHPVGGPKAKFFLGRGFNKADWEGMADALRHHARNNPVVRRVTFPFGTKYTLDCHLPTPDKSNPCIRTVWEVRPDDERPRLITAHPLSG
ncbi:MAG: hypothetical protein K0R17_4086 [Rariglobus sp.]|jgi:hypothetical protein|nr:hypothetical protein [Rariglobus sp.]